MILCSQWIQNIQALLGDAIVSFFCRHKTWMIGEEKLTTTLVPQTVTDLFQMGTGVQRILQILDSTTENQGKILPVLSVQWGGLLCPKVRLTPVLSKRWGISTFVVGLKWSYTPHGTGKACLFQTKCLGTMMVEKEKFIWLLCLGALGYGCWTWLLFGLFEVVHYGGRKLLTLWQPGNRDSGRAPDIPFKDPRSEIYFLPSRSNLLSFLPPPNTLLLANQGFHWWDCQRGAILYPNCDK